MLNSIKLFAVFVCLTLCTALFANTTISMHLTTANGDGQSVGTVTIIENKYGLLFIPKLRNLTSGLHGFHIHEMPSCEQNGMAAGGHFDPKKTGKHLGPYNDNGHLGDLPPIHVAANGTATLPVIAPRLLNLKEIEKKSLMLHEGGDNYSDEPMK